jgi:hypothetical protein
VNRRQQFVQGGAVEHDGHTGLSSFLRHEDLSVNLTRSSGVVRPEDKQAVTGLNAFLKLLVPFLACSEVVVPINMALSM